MGSGAKPARAVRRNGWQRLYVLMAAGAGTGAGTAPLVPALSAAVINLSLERFARELPAGVHAVLTRDGAGYRTSQDLVAPGNVSLIPSPPYPPEFNPVANLRHYLRSHHWSNRADRDYIIEDGGRCPPYRTGLLRGRQGRRRGAVGSRACPPSISMSSSSAPGSPASGPAIPCGTAARPGAT